MMQNSMKNLVELKIVTQFQKSTDLQERKVNGMQTTFHHGKGLSRCLQSQTRRTRSNILAIENHVCKITTTKKWLSNFGYVARQGARLGISVFPKERVCSYLGKLQGAPTFPKEQIAQNLPINVTKTSPTCDDNSSWYWREPHNYLPVDGWQRYHLVKRCTINSCVFTIGWSKISSCQTFYHQLLCMYV